MHFDIHYRKDVINKIENIIGDMSLWNQESDEDAADFKRIANYAESFDHCVKPLEPFTICGADSSGDFPVTTYNDSYIYLVTALTRLYTAVKEGYLKEEATKDCNIVDFLWLPDDKGESDKRFEIFFENLIQKPLLDLCRESDYLSLRKSMTGKKLLPEELLSLILKPNAHDANNVRIHLMTAAELCTIARIFQLNIQPTYMIADTTLTLPLIKQRGCLFFELVKRYCCQLARKRGSTFLALSKSHNIPHMDRIMEEIANKIGEQEHWYLRIPTIEEDNFRPKFLGARGIPPVGGITYILRFHKNTPPMRVDLDKYYWKEKIWSDDSDLMLQREQKMFSDLDFTTHDQRSYGYPYPVKASHNNVSLTNAEKEALRKQIIDAAERAGLKRQNFTDISLLTGHS